MNEIITTVPRERIRDLNSLPFPNRSLIDLEKYNKYIGISHFDNYISLFTSRGCPFKCKFCHKIWPREIVCRSADNIFSEVSIYYDVGYRNFAIFDDAFNAGGSNSVDFFKLILKHKYKIQLSFPNGLRGDILDKDYIDLMIEAGTVHLGVALETASPRLQKLIGKNLNIGKLRENIDYITTKYPHVVIDIFSMLGFPTETEDEALQTIDFIKTIRWSHFPLLHSVHIYPNTEMEQLYLEHGGTVENMLRSGATAFHEIPDTLPYSKEFLTRLKSTFFKDYILNAERLADTLPQQMKVFSESAIVQKYNSYFVGYFDKCFQKMEEIFKFFNLDMQVGELVLKESIKLEQVNLKVEKKFPPIAIKSNALKILLLDLTKYFSSNNQRLIYHIEQPMGLLCLASYLSDKYGGAVNCKIASSKVDFDSYDELKELLLDFAPDLIGIRTLTVYKEFFHESVALIKSILKDIPIVAGGPYATSEYSYILEDKNISIVVIGEGEVTFAELVGAFIKNNQQLPDSKVLSSINGLSFTKDNFGS